MSPSSVKRCSECFMALQSGLALKFRGFSLSDDAELLLQARRRGRVLKHDPLLREDDVDRRLRHQGGFVEAAEDQLELAGVSIDVADREDPRLRALELGSIDRDQVFMQVDPPIRDRAELHGEAEERENTAAGNRALLAVLVLDDRRGHLSLVAAQSTDLTEGELDLTGLDE